MNGGINMENKILQEILKLLVSAIIIGGTTLALIGLCELVTKQIFPFH